MRVFYQSYAHFLEPCAKRIWMLSAFFAFLLPGCDSERDKEWKEWRTEISKVDYRCGTIGEYELKINKAYISSWPVYEGRSDWESKPPPPLSCTAKLAMMPIELYWPDLRPAGRRPLSITIDGADDPDYIRVAVRYMPNFVSWDIATVLKLSLRHGDDPVESLGGQIQTKIGLYRAEKSYRRLSLSSQTYYWQLAENDSLITFVECTVSDNKLVNYCEQQRYLPWLGAFMDIRYSRPQLNNWKSIGNDVENFIKRNSAYRGN